METSAYAQLLALLEQHMPAGEYPRATELLSEALHEARHEGSLEQGYQNAVHAPYWA